MLPYKIEIKDPGSFEVRQLKDFKHFLSYHGGIERSLDSLADCIKLGFFYVDIKEGTIQSPCWELVGIQAIKGRDSAIEDVLRKFFFPKEFQWKTFYELGYLVFSKEHRDKGYSSLLRAEFYRHFHYMNLCSFINRENKKVLNTNNKYGFTQIGPVDFDKIFSINKDLKRLKDGSDIPS